MCLPRVLMSQPHPDSSLLGSAPLSPRSLAASRVLGNETQAPEPKGRTVITVILT